MKIKWFSILFLFFVQIQEKGCEKEKDVPEGMDYSVYDNYILDLPLQRDLYAAANIRKREMMVLEIEDLPGNEKNVVRMDFFGTDGRLLKIEFKDDVYKDSIVYEYTALGQIEKEHIYHKERDSTTTQYYYHPSGMMTQVIHYRDQVTAYDMYHNSHYKLTDKRISEESPTHSDRREIYKFDSMGRMIQGMVLVKNVPTEKEKRYYDGKHRISKKEFLHQGLMMQSSQYIYNDAGLLSIRKDKTRLAKDDFSEKVFEFVYTTF